MTVQFTGIKGVPTTKIRHNPNNPRRNFGDIDELAVSLRTQGVLQPLIVAPIEGTDEFELVDGARRLTAATKAGLPAVPCLITSKAGRSAQVATMLAAAMHKQLDPLEQCDAFRELLAAGLKINDIAAQTGYSATTVRDRLRLSALPTEAKKLLRTGRMSVTQATSLAGQVHQSTNKSGSTAVGSKTSQPFTSAHPCAAEAREICTHHDTRQVLGGVACGQCWEAAIRADERNSYDVDEAAIQRALSGDRTVKLNARELHEAILRLLDQGMSAGDAARHLGTTARQAERAKTVRRNGLAAAS